MDIMIKNIDDHEWIPSTKQIISLIRHWYPEYKITDEEYEKLDKFIEIERNKTDHHETNFRINHSIKCNIINSDTDIFLYISIVKRDNKHKYRGDGISIVYINEISFYRGIMKNWVNF